MKVVRSVLLATMVCVGLLSAGCAEMAQLAPFAVQGAQVASTDSSKPRNDGDALTLKLKTPTTSETFVRNAKAVTRDLGYQVQTVQGSGSTWIVVAVKQETPIGLKALFGMRDFTYIMVRIQLEGDGQTIQVSSTNMSNTEQGDVGAATKVINSFKNGLQQLYAKNGSS